MATLQHLTAYCTVCLTNKNLQNVKKLNILINTCQTYNKCTPSEFYPTQMRSIVSLVIIKQTSFKLSTNKIKPTSTDLVCLSTITPDFFEINPQSTVRIENILTVSLFSLGLTLSNPMYPAFNVGYLLQT